MIEGIKNDLKVWLEEMQLELSNCRCCPHNCGVNRLNSELGICRTDASFPIASVSLHLGEEPAISGVVGICNIFFAHCNLQCQFCQNHQISNNHCETDRYDVSLESLLKEILHYLDQGVHALGFVSPSHVIPQVKVIAKSIRKLRPDCVLVFNTNAYDKVKVIREMDGLVDVWLPDLKYLDSTLSGELSGVKNYPEIAKEAIREMYRQKGTQLRLDAHGKALSGLIIRHLVLPGSIENSRDVLQFIADELSPRVWVSVMSQYFPAHKFREHPVFGRMLLYHEYAEVIAIMERLGLDRGWVQELESAYHYKPDFEKSKPFE